MRLILVVCLSAIAGFALATGTQFEPTIEDDGFEYFQGKNEHAETQSGFYNLDIVDGEVTVRLSDEPSLDSLTHVFDGIQLRPSNGEWRRLYGPTTLNRADEQEEDQAVVLANLRELAGMQQIRAGWTITHGELSLADAISAYAEWFSDAGAAMTFDPTNAVGNVRPFNVTGLSDDLRVVFHRDGAGVRVYIGYR